MELISGLTNFAATSIEMVGNKTNTLTSDIVTIANAVIGVLGLVAVVVIVVGGVSYMTSSGDAGKVKKGKDTILYGVIGLIICALAFAIVNWVIGGLLGGGSSSGGSDDGDKAAMTECIKAKGEWKDGACVYKDGSSTK